MEEPSDRHQPPRKVKRRAGTPQGGVISPLLANPYLHWMDKRFHGPEGPAQRTGARRVRYADDVVILTRYQGRFISDWIDATVEDGMGRKINREKTRIVKLSEPGVSLEFPGYSFRYEADRFGRARRFLNRVPSAKACAREREKLRGMISAKQVFVPTPQADCDGQSPGPWVGQLLRAWTQPPRVSRLELVPPKADGTAPETSEPAPLPATERGDLVCAPI